MAKRHYDATPPDSVMSQSLCGWFGGAGFTTTDPESVTCKPCLRKLASAQAAESEQAAKFDGDYVDDGDFLEATREPLPVGRLSRAQAAAWRHVMEQVARAVTRESDRERSRQRPETRFRGVSHALAVMVQARADGAPVGTLSDPKRLLRQSCFGQQGGGRPGVDRAIQLAEDLHHVRQAWELAFEGEWRGILRERDCREALLFRYVGELRVRDVAQLVSERIGYPVKPKLVGTATRTGYGRIWEHLGERGLIPLARPTRNTAEGEMVENSRPKADVRGWKGVADFFDVHPDTAREWHRRWPMPLRRFNGRIEASSVELQQWRDEHTEDLAS